jgi:manganese/zinc/iron transport system permease protein
MATVTLIMFGVLFIFAPQKGSLAAFLRQRTLTTTLHLLTLMTHIQNHVETEEAAVELNPQTLHQHFNWSTRAMDHLLKLAQKEAYIETHHQQVRLTSKGIDFYQAMGRSY